MNLEPGVNPSVIDPDVWEWMRNYRVWEANREIFLYPENWIEPSLRDDKTPFFVDLENQLLQSNITTDTAEQAFLDYLEKLDQVGRLDICGMYSQYEDLPDGVSDILHVFGRTRNTPSIYYYRQRINDSQWTAWEQITLDIQTDHLMPVVYDRRLYLFWATFVEKSDSDQDLGAPMIESRQHWEWRKQHDAWKIRDHKWQELDDIYNALETADQQEGTNFGVGFLAAYNSQPDPQLSYFDPNHEPKEPREPQVNEPTITHWEITLNWSEYWQNAWTPKQTSSAALHSPSVSKNLRQVLSQAWPGWLWLQDDYLLHLVNPMNNFSIFQPNWLQHLGEPTLDTIVDLYLPGIGCHFFRTREDSGGMVLELYRRYHHDFDLPPGKDDLKTFLKSQPLTPATRQEKTKAMEQALSIENFEYVGEFRLDDCRGKVRAISDLKRQNAYDALPMPDDSDNTYQTFREDSSGVSALTFTEDKHKIKVLRHIPSSVDYDCSTNSSA